MPDLQLLPPAAMVLSALVLGSLQQLAALRTSLRWRRLMKTCARSLRRCG